MEDNCFDNISVVLVETIREGNTGSVARAMNNMGLQRLKLVNPREAIADECRMMAGKAISLVNKARFYGSLDEALVGENVVVGTTSLRDRRPDQPLQLPSEMAPLICDYGRSQRVALVFGPERSGLTDAQLARCQHLVSIPANPDHPVLNLAQAVMVIAYEIYSATSISPNPMPELASDETRDKMFRHVERVLVDIGFLSSGTPGHIMSSIRRFLGRAGLTPRDVQIIRGIMSQMEWYIEEGRKLPAEKIRKP